MLYDADKIEKAAGVYSKEELYDAQLDVFLDPNDPVVIEAARADGIPEDWIASAQKSPISASDSPNWFNLCASSKTESMRNLALPWGIALIVSLRMISPFRQIRP